MRAAFTTTLRAWLCLAAAVCLGLVPSQALILCLGPDGTVALESRPATGDCGGCPELGSGEAERAAFVAPAGESSCPCTDLLVGGHSSESKTKPKGAELALQALLAVPLASSALFVRAPAHSHPPSAGPLVDPLLASLASDVLRL